MGKSSRSGSQAPLLVLVVVPDWELSEEVEDSLLIELSELSEERLLSLLEDEIELPLTLESELDEDISACDSEEVDEVEESDDRELKLDKELSDDSELEERLDCEESELEEEMLSLLPGGNGPSLLLLL